MGCFYHITKNLLAFFFLFFLIGTLVMSIFIDAIHVINGEKPYFFNPDKIESFKEPMLKDFEQKLIDNYDKNQFEFQNLEDYIGYLPDNDKFRIEFISDKEVEISGTYKQGGYRYNSSVDFTDNENTQYLSELGWTRSTIESLQERLASTNCISFEKKDGFRAGFVDARSGTYYYRFSNFDDAQKQSSLLDSCLIRYYKNNIFIEYKGFGRGPDCVKYENGPDFDNRNYFEKWRDIFKQGGIKTGSN